MNRILLWLGIFLFIPPPTMRGAGEGFSEYLPEVWRTEDGLPENTVTAIAQTPDGYLWLATFNGLARFDGRRFVIFDSANTPQLKSSRIHQLHPDVQGQLWVISEFGHLTRILNNHFTEFGPAQGLPKPAVVMQEDAQGRLWVDTQREKFLFSNGKFIHGIYSNYLTIDHWPVPAGQVEPPAKTNWNPHRANFRPGFMARVSYPPTTGEGRTIGSRDGGVWIVNQQVQKFRDGRWVRAMTPPEPINAIGSLCEDRQGNFWVGTWDQGLFRFSPSGEFRRFKLSASSTHWPVRHIFEDREGNLWIGSGGDGLWRLKPRAVTTYDNSSGMKSDVVRSVAEDHEGQIWVCNLGGIDWFSREVPHRAQPSNLTIPIPWSLLTDRRGAVWITTYESGLFKFDHGKLTRFVEDTVSPPPTVNRPALNVVYEDRNGEIHIGTHRGLHRIEGAHLRPAEKPLGAEPMDVRAMGEDHLGNFYVGLNGGGLLRRKAGQWSQFTKRDGLSADHIWSLYVDADNTVWLGTVGNGLSRFRDGKFFNFTASHLSLPRLITCILEDDEGRLWFGSNQGIFRAGREQLNAFADGNSKSLTAVQYGKSDGMGSSECVGSRQPTACKTRDGRLWFPTVRGLSVVDPKKLPFNPEPPAVIIEEVIADGERIVSRNQSPGNSGAGNAVLSRQDSEIFADIGMRSSARAAPLQSALAIPAGKSRIEIHYTGLSFIAPEKVRFKYRLEGYDHDWVETGTRRIAYYTRLSPGDYTFRVIAANADGVWNEKGAALALIMAPAWWQTIWFRAAIPISAGLLLTGVYFGRVRALKRAHLEQEEFSRRLIASQEQERQRIAAELHDGLGQSLLVIKSQAILAGRKINIETDTAERLKDLSEMAGQAINEVRTIAQHLRPFHLDQLGLTRAVRGMVTQVTRSADLAVTHEFADVDGAFSPDSEINFFRMAQELLNNIIKHAQATEVRVVLTRDSHEVIMRVEDNGRGFDASARANEGFGLRNVAERVRIMGGKWDIRSEPGKGTTVEIRLPTGVKGSGHKV